MRTNTQQDRASALPAAAAFVAIGGSIMLSPTGRLDAALDPAAIFAADVAPSAARKAERAASAMKAQLRSPRAVRSLKALVLRQGERTPGGWLVVGGR